MTKHVNWGLIGAGAIAHRFAADMGHSQTGRLVAVASRSRDKAAAFAQAHGNVQVADDYGALLQRDDIDAVYIATPNSLHKAHCLQAIAAGKAVLCEKPLATSLREAEAIAAAAQAAGVFVMEAMWTRFLPLMRDIKARLDRDEIGAVSQLSVSLGFGREHRPGSPITDPALGGGALLDLGVYGVSIAHYLLGEAECVGAVIARSDDMVERNAAVILRHRVGGRDVAAVIQAGHDTHMPNQLEICGERGRLRVDAPFLEARQGRLIPVQWSDYAAAGAAGGGGLKGLIKGSPLFPLARGLYHKVKGAGGQVLSGAYPGTGMQFEIDEVGACLGAGRSDSAVMPLGASAAVQKLMAQARVQALGSTE